MADIGVKVYGGCCGTTAEYISVLKQMLEEYDIAKIVQKLFL